MALLSFLRRLYSLDTLDTRFTISSTTPPKQAASEPRIDPAKPSLSESKNAARADPRTPGPQPSKWNTPEFYLYYLVFLTAIPSMFYVVYDVSKGAYALGLVPTCLADCCQNPTPITQSSSLSYPPAGSLAVKWYVLS